MTPPASVTPILPEVGFIGTGDVFLSPSSSKPGVVHIVVHVGQLWACSCEAGKVGRQCVHVRRAREVVE